MSRIVIGKFTISNMNDNKQQINDKEWPENDKKTASLAFRKLNNQIKNDIQDRKTKFPWIYGEKR